MFGSEVLEVGIGMALLFAFISLIVTAIREFVEGLLQTRAGDLERGIRELLADPSGQGWAKDLYNHPIVFSLFRGNYVPAKLSGKSGGAERTMTRAGRLALPAYIPSRHFATALLDMVTNGRDCTNRGGGTALTFATLRASVDQIENANVKASLQAVLNTAGNDLDIVRSNIEDWYNGTMDRVSGWYKKRTQWIVFWLGLATAAALNVDAITVASRLLSNPSLRKAIVAQAELYVERRASEEAARAGEPAPPAAPPPVDPAAPASPSGGAGAPPAAASSPRTPASPAVRTGTNAESASSPLRAKATEVKQLTEQFSELGFPIGWPPPQLRTCSRRDGQTVCVQPASTNPGDWGLSWIPAAAGGWLVTALAIMLGAPSWFDVLNKFMVIRSTVKPTEKSKDENSEDRQTGAEGPFKLVLSRERSTG